jgi:hypothetical protein
MSPTDRRSFPADRRREVARAWSAACAVVAVLFAAPGAAADPPHGRDREGGCRPSITLLPTPAGWEQSEALSIGPWGLIGGFAWKGEGRAVVQNAVLWLRGEPRDLGIPGFVADVNARGDVLVNSAFFGPVSRGIIVHGSQQRDLEGLGGDFVYVRRLNDRGDVAGSATDAEGIERPVMWRHGRDPVELGLPAGAEWGFAQGINERRQLVGIVVGGPYGFGQAWLWEPDGRGRALGGGPFAPDDPGASIANVIDDRGRAGGDFGATLTPQLFAAVWVGNARRLLGFGGDFATILGANGDGDFVGIAHSEPGGAHHILLTRAGGPALTLMPKSGDWADEASAHGASERFRGDVTVAGRSLAVPGGPAQATLWHCAYRQAFPPPAVAAAAGRSSRALTRDAAVTRAPWRLTTAG